jgi:hypothetical protein
MVGWTPTSIASTAGTTKGASASTEFVDAIDALEKVAVVSR